MGFIKSSLSEGKLAIELIPKTSFFSNLRAVLSKSDWDFIRKQSYRKYNYKCAICSGVGKKHPVECHELWSFDDKNQIQRLDGVIALCPACHSVVHFGLSEVRGYGDDALNHLKKVNKWNDKKVNKHIQEAFDLWNERSNLAWTLDIMTYLKEVGLDKKYG